MADKIGEFLTSWQQLGSDDKAKGIATFTKQQIQPQVQDTKPELKTTTKSDEFSSKVYDGIQLYSYYSYLYYYPTMHWSLDKTPDTDDYWVGIYEKGAADDKYLAYQWVKKAAQSSYYIGKLSTTVGPGVASTNRSEEYELRIFKGDDRRLDAKTNVIRGRILNAPSDPSSPDAYQVFASIESKQLDGETRDFIRAVETPGASPGKLHLEDLRKLWNSFAPFQQQLLFPILEQDSLPDEIKKPGPKALDCPEPKIRFPQLGRTKGLKEADDPVKGPNKIVLTITLDWSYTYIYPVVDVKQVVPTKLAWMGMYYTQSDVHFDPEAYIDNDWQWVGNGQAGETKLSDIKEKEEGPTNNQYVGAIFDYSSSASAYVQIGIAASTIEATISVTPAVPPPEFIPDFEKTEALRYAKLSQLAYQPYSVVIQELPKYNLVAKMQIYDQNSNTNGFIASDDTSVVVAFRGTEKTSWKNILTDLWFVKAPINPDEKVYGHKGFITAMNTVYESIKAELKPHLGQKKLFITGHSLGGALATLLTYRISLAYDISQPIQYVYGCPPVGDIDLATYFTGMDSNTITIQNDPVSSGTLILLGEWNGLYKPNQVKYLPKTAGHGIADYIHQLENLRM